jgi:uncharacterized phage-associated protein
MDKLPLDGRSVANYILIVRRHFGYSTTNLELQKLLYFIYGKFLVKNGEKLFEGYFEAWEHGPVHPHLYKEFRRYGASPITRRASSTDFVSGDSRIVPPPQDARLRSFIAETVLQLRGLTASQLREKSHSKGGPWHSIWESARVNLASQVIIPDSVIRERYSRHILPLNATLERDRASEDHPPQRDRSR